MPAGAFARWLEEYSRAQLQAEPAGEVPIDPELAPTDASELAKAALFVHEIFLQADSQPRDDQQLAAAINHELRARAPG